MANGSISRTTKRGRPSAGERAVRRQRILDAAHDEIAEHGYEGATMLAIARRAGASKETLYAWFGSREKLLATMIEENGEVAAERIRAALSSDLDPRVTLTAFATGLLTLLTGERSIAFNRAAMASPKLARILLESGRHRVGPIVETYLLGLRAEGVLQFADAKEAFRLLYGLVVRDTQICVLLGERAPSKRRISLEASRAVDEFLWMTSNERP